MKCVIFFSFVGNSIYVNFSESLTYVHLKLCVVLYAFAEFSEGIRDQEYKIMYYG